MNASSVRAIARSRAVVALLEEAAKVVVISLLFVFEEKRRRRILRKKEKIFFFFLGKKRGVTLYVLTGYSLKSKCDLPLRTHVCQSAYSKTRNKKKIETMRKRKKDKTHVYPFLILD